MTDADLTQRARDEAMWVHVVIEGDRETFRRGSFGYVMAQTLIRATDERDALAARHDALRAGIGHMADLMDEVWKDPRLSAAKGTYGRGARDVITDTVTRLRDLLAEDGPC